nr:hypothetical protein Itr_chr12CG16660 [Ipomoea trifida]
MAIFPRRRTTGLLFAGSSAEQRCTKVVGVAQRRDAEEAGWSLSFISLRFRVLSIRMTTTRLREEERRRRRWHWFSSDDGATTATRERFFRHCRRGNADFLYCRTPFL